MMVKYHFGRKMGQDWGRCHAEMLVVEALRYRGFFFFFNFYIIIFLTGKF